jgi:hypothetical protein
VSKICITWSAIKGSCELTDCGVTDLGWSIPVMVISADLDSIVCTVINKYKLKNIHQQNS